MESKNNQKQKQFTKEIGIITSSMEWEEEPSKMEITMKETSSMVVPVDTEYTITLKTNIAMKDIGKMIYLMVMG